MKVTEEALKPVARIHEDRRARVEAWGTEKKWDPAFKERAYGSRRAGWTPQLAPMVLLVGTGVLAFGVVRRS